jgi:hypothetical protein
MLFEGLTSDPPDDTEVFLKHDASENNQSQQTLKIGFRFERSTLRLEQSLIGVSVHLADCQTLGVPGGPALPHCVVRIALPPQTRLTKVATGGIRSVVVGESVPVAPLQPMRAGVSSEQKAPEGSPPYRRDNEIRLAKRKLRRPFEQPPKDAFVPIPAPAFVPPDPALYAQAARQSFARVIGESLEGLTPVVEVMLYPVRLTQDGQLVLHTRFDLILHHEPDLRNEQPKVPSGIISKAQAQRQVALTRRGVLNGDFVIDYSDLFGWFQTEAEYLIITDNQTWDAERIIPTGSVDGDVVATFERLAQWKRQRCLKAKVVTVTDIVAGRYGSFQTGARDLQEVLRNFLKMAQSRWGTAWVLLGGDVSIIPVRTVAGDRLGEVIRQSVDPPPQNVSVWHVDHLRIHAVNLGDWWSNAIDNKLVRLDSGLLIPYDAMGTSGTQARGWYFTDESYLTRSETATNFVRVNGPEAEVNADLRFLYHWNTIPTDLYYSSLIGPGYNQPGKHDWDALDNGVYGQHQDLNLDGIHFVPSVSLGRAPVRSALDAEAFVNKVIAYEGLRLPDGTELDDGWTRKMVVASENWFGKALYGFSENNPPPAQTYHHAPGANHSLIQIGSPQNPNWDWTLLAYQTDSEASVVPYRTDAEAAGLGWYFARSATDMRPSFFNIGIASGVTAWLPVPSAWVVVFGPEPILKPGAFFMFNQIGLDGSLSDQEMVREIVQGQTLSFSQRLYEDVEDMTPAQVTAAPLERLSRSGMIEALNGAPHLVSLSGHGDGGYCCRLDHAAVDGLTNGFQSFIVYADSCLTNEFDGDALSEHLVRNPNGGAVAYVGNSRFSWIGLGDDYQRRFFERLGELAGCAHLGLLADSRATLFGTGDADNRWAMLSLNLIGDPEMPVWFNRPLKIEWSNLTPIEVFEAVFAPPEPPGPDFRLPYLKNWGLTFVQLKQGENEHFAVSDHQGRVRFPLTNFKSGEARLTLSRPGHQPLEVPIKLERLKPAKSN